MTQTIQYALWLSGPLLQGAIGTVMLRRKLYREYPIFLTYTASHVLRFAVLYLVHETAGRGTYRQAYAYLEAVDAVLSFAVLYELYAATFRAYEGIRELGWILLRWSAVILAGVAVVNAASSTGSDSVRFLGGLFTLEQSVSIVRGGLLFLLFLLHAALGLRWSGPTLGIALGFGLLSSIELVTFALRLHFGVEATAVLSLISSIAYSCAILLWLVAVARPAGEAKPTPQLAKWDIEAWNRTLLELLQR